jgi:formyl-CoA transferase
VSYPAPAAIFVSEPRQYGAVPAIGERTDRRKTGLRKSS